MNPLDAVVLAASTPRTVGIVIAVVATAGFIIYALVNLRAARDEVGAEIELAPNRKPYLPDEVLEGDRLTKTLSVGLITLAVVGVGLPLYWLNEPGRQDGAIEEFGNVFASRGEAQFGEDGSQCVNCHGQGATGGIANYALTDEDGEFVAQVSWRAPALNTVLLRYSREEVTYIINYGRPFSPMQPWGTVGGGPLNEQQVQNLVDYFESIKLTPEASQQAVEGELRTALDLGADAKIDYTDPAVGKALFNLGRESGFAGGAYACGRCHTRGWSIDLAPDTEPRDPEKFAALVEHPDGAGALGPNLRGGLIPRQFLSLADLVEFVTTGSEDGKLYGVNGQGSGKMPGFGDDPDDDSDPDDDAEADGMLTADMIKAITRYEASLEAEESQEG